MSPPCGTCRGGRFAEAEPLARKAVESAREFLPSGHPDRIDKELELAVTLAELRPDEALAAYEELVAGCRSFLTEHPREAGVRTILASALLGQGRLERQLGREDETTRSFAAVEEAVDLDRADEDLAWTAFRARSLLQRGMNADAAPLLEILDKASWKDENLDGLLDNASPREHEMVGLRSTLRRISPRQ